MKNKIFNGETSIDVQTLVERLQRVTECELIGYRELTLLIGRDVTVYRHLTDSARRILLRDHNMVFRSVMNEGLQRLSDAQVVDVVNTDRKKRIRRQASKAIQELSCVKYEALDKPRQVSQNTGMALFGALYQSTGKASVKALQRKIENAGGRIDLNGTLKLLGWLAE